jgi:3-hydroxymyristoyl/3-hydroxydecanoyl-(acyl carrier protein) dehydratase
VPHRIEHAFPADHPTAAGHFPGNPVIPGAVLLDVVLRAVFGGESGACEVRSAKFLHPVRPGDVMSVRWNDDAAIRFDCAVGGRAVLTGSVRR